MFSASTLSRLTVENSIKHQNATIPGAKFKIPPFQTLCPLAHHQLVDKSNGLFRNIFSEHELSYPLPNRLGAGGSSWAPPAGSGSEPRPPTHFWHIWGPQNTSGRENSPNKAGFSVKNSLNRRWGACLPLPPLRIRPCWCVCKFAFGQLLLKMMTSSPPTLLSTLSTDTVKISRSQRRLSIYSMQAYKAQCLQCSVRNVGGISYARKFQLGSIAHNQVKRTHHHHIT